MKILKQSIIFLLCVGLIACSRPKQKGYNKLDGHAFGTAFSIVYNSSKDYSQQIDSLFHLLNKSLSTYLSSSDISKINQGDTTILIDSFFMEVFTKSQSIYKETNGAFDPTIGVLVNAWGFGPENIKRTPDSAAVKELLKKVGFDKIELKNGFIIKNIPGIYLDFNAIAKGYAVDIAGRFLESQAISDYLVEIGGEIRARGLNAQDSLWKAGIENPNLDGTRSINKVIELDNESIATSGSYRKFKIDSLSGQKYIHILNPKTGYPRVGHLLSVSIIAKRDCADTDAYATALMAMSLDEAMAFLQQRPNLKSFIIYSDNKGDLKTFSSLNL